MNKTVLIVGGARSGKSSHAVEMASLSKQEVVFLATCTFHDEEMDERVRRHQSSRPAQWKTINEGILITERIAENKNQQILLIDCLGMWVFNLMEKYPEDGVIEDEFAKLVKILGQAQGTIIVVSNEVGCGIVPEYASARRYRDLLGRLNQMTARVVAEVIMMQIGIPTRLK